MVHRQEKKLTLPAVPGPDGGDEDGRLIERLSLDVGEAARDRALEIARRLTRRPRTDPNLARSIRRLVGRLSSVDEIRRRLDREPPARRGCDPPPPTPDEIKERAAAVRGLWVDGGGVLVRSPDNDELPDRGPGIRVCEEPTFR